MSAASFINPGATAPELPFNYSSIYEKLKREAESNQAFPDLIKKLDDLDHKVTFCAAREFDPAFLAFKNSIAAFGRSCGEYKNQGQTKEQLSAHCFGQVWQEQKFSKRMQLILHCINRAERMVSAQEATVKVDLSREFAQVTQWYKAAKNACLQPHLSKEKFIAQVCLAPFFEEHHNLCNSPAKAEALIGLLQDRGYSPDVCRIVRSTMKSVT